MALIAIGGKAGVGKTTLAHAIKKHMPVSWWVCSLADALKEEIHLHFGIPLQVMYDQKRKHETVTVPEFGVVTIRELMQKWGDMQRAKDPFYYVRLFVKKYDERFGGVICDDVRFLSEFWAFKNRGAYLIKLLPWDGWQPGPGADHQSERELDEDDLPWDDVVQLTWDEIEPYARKVAWEVSHGNVRRA